jgi:hypothetical protein
MADQVLVDAAQPAAVGGVDGHSQGSCLTVHRAARRDDEIRERNQALRVDGLLGDDHRRQGERAHVVALLLGPRDHERVHVLQVAEVLEGHREQRIRMAVVQRDIGRRAQHDEDALGIEVPVGEDSRVGLEVREVVLLLQAGVLLQLGRCRPVGRETLRRDCAGHDHAGRRAAAELVLQPRPLVVEGRRARDAEAVRGHRQLVGAVREREVEVAAARPAAQ